MVCIIVPCLPSLGMTYQSIRNFLDNLKFNKWTTLREVERDKQGLRFFECQCECGYIGIVRLTYLKNNMSTQCKRCGYKFKKSVTVIKLQDKAGNHSHGMSKTASYDTWSSIINRVRSKSGYKFQMYAAKGIGISEDWNKFENFYRDMGERPSGSKVCRINKKLGYSKENCIWR